MFHIILLILIASEIVNAFVNFYSRDAVLLGHRMEVIASLALAVCYTLMLGNSVSLVAIGLLIGIVFLPVQFLYNNELA